jgi:hypothetical protein
MQTHRKWKAIGATAASSLALLAAAGLGTGAQAAGTLHSCGNHSYTIEVPSGTEAPANKFKVTAKNINESGTTCAAAIKFVEDVYKATVPPHFKCTNAKLKEPRYFIPEQCTRGGVKIQFGHQGG